MIAISIVVPVYNVQKWLPRFFTCLQRQTFKNFEVLLIDDASPDKSSTLIEKIATADPRFKLITLPENRGAGGARNVGILAARGETICFADPDDLLPNNSLEVRYAAFKKHRAVVRACHHEIMDSGEMRNIETRPAGLPNVFSPADVANRVGVNPFLCAHWTWLWPTSLLQKNKIFHGEGLRTGDDIYMLVQLLFRMNRVVWIDDVVYYWIKRAESLSTTVYTPEHYGNYFTCCDMFYDEAAKRNQTPLADMFFNEYLLTYPGHLLMQISQGKSTEQDTREVIGQMTRVAEKHAVFPRCQEAIQKNPLRYPGINRLLHILGNSAPSAIQRLADSQALLAPLIREIQYQDVRMKGWSHKLKIDKFDSVNNLLRVRYEYSDTLPKEVTLCGKDEQTPSFSKNRTVHVGRQYTIFERILWLALPADANTQLHLLINEQPTSLHHTAAEIRAAFAPIPLDDTNFPPDIRALRRLATSPAIQEKFKDAWMFIDRDTEADDNAEHLYRWVSQNHPELNIWFVLDQESHDWPRLEAEGFRLLAHESMEHYLLFLSCKKLISSQTDKYIYSPFNEQYCSDFPKPQYVCLRHGVSKDNISNRVNGIPIDFFVTVTNDEWQSFVIDKGPYELTEKEVILTGFPRHDKLVQPVEMENIIFVMPTWRANLVGAWNGRGQRRKKNPNFNASNYVAIWKDFLCDPRTEELVKKFQYRIVYFAHPGFADYVDNMPYPDYVEKLSKKSCSLLELMRKSKILITDFSSIAFDKALIKNPILYFQAEHESEYIQAQDWKKGYFDYESMGFGPICHNKESLLNRLEEAIQANGQMQPPYIQRVEATFPYHDTNNCQRIYKAITKDQHREEKTSL